MKLKRSLKIPLHEPCAPVAEVFGDTETAEELMQEPGATDESEHIANGIRWKHASQTSHPYDSYASGKSAERALRINKCGRCALQACLVKDMLQTAADGKPYQEEARPRQDASEQTTALFDLVGKDIVLAWRDDTPSENLSQELRSLNTSGDTDLPTVVIHNPQTKTPPVEIIDASSIINHGDTLPANPDQSRWLFEKLAILATERDSNNRPQMYNPSTLAVRMIGGQSKKGGQLYEVRMDGKPRLYFIGCPPAANRPHDRVIIVGSHGDSEKSQTTFLKTVMVEKTKH